MTSLGEALKCLGYNIRKEEHRVQASMGTKLQRIRDGYIEEETNFDSQRPRLTKRTLIPAIQDAVIEVGEKTHEEDPDLNMISYSSRPASATRWTQCHAEAPDSSNSWRSSNRSADRPVGQPAFISGLGRPGEDVHAEGPLGWTVRVGTRTVDSYPSQTYS